MTAEIVPTERDGGFLVVMDGRPQSHVDLDDPGRLEFDYVRRMADVLDAHGEPGAPLRVLHVGGAGLTLPRYVAHTRPRSGQVVLEPEEDVTDVVRRELPLPRRSGIKVRPVDGRTGLAPVREGSMDAVVVDAFAGGRVPADLVTAECAAAYARVLDDSGTLLLNLVDAAPFTWTRRVVAAVRPVLPALMVSAEPRNPARAPSRQSAAGRRPRRRAVRCPGRAGLEQRVALPRPGRGCRGRPVRGRPAVH